MRQSRALRRGSQIDFLSALIICALMKIENEPCGTVAAATAGDESTPPKHQLADLAPLLYVIANVSKHFRRRVQEEAKGFELTLPQWKVLAHLSSTTGIAQSALANLVEADAMTVSGILERLEARGYATRSPNPKDSRAKVVHGTALAEREVAKMRDVARQIYTQVLEGIPADDIAVALATLSKISDNLAGLSDQNKDADK